MAADRVLAEIRELMAQQLQILSQLRDVQLAQHVATHGRPPPPPTSGPGSGVAAWIAHARQIGVAVPDGATREEVIAACQQ